VTGATHNLNRGHGTPVTARSRWWQSTPPYAQGDIFVVPLGRPAPWAVGVVSRTSMRSPNLVLAHYFSVLITQPVIGEVPSLLAEDAVLICRVSDLALRDGLWPVIGRISDWSMEQWPMPRFSLPPRLGHPGREETYYEQDPGHRRRSTIIEDAAVARALPNGETIAAGFAVQRLITVLQPKLGLTTPTAAAPAGLVA
jgi:hypothetical protein